MRSAKAPSNIKFHTHMLIHQKKSKFHTCSFNSKQKYVVMNACIISMYPKCLMHKKQVHTSHIYIEFDVSEALILEYRPWHSSPVVPKSTKEHAIHKRPKPQECPHEGACKLLYDEDHLSKFTHECGAGFLCANVDPLHRLRFRYPSDNPNDPWEGKTGWKAENFRSPCCAPAIQEAKLQTGLPRFLIGSIRFLIGPARIPGCYPMVGASCSRTK